MITSGNLQLEFEEEDSITLENAMPMYDEVGLIQKPYIFTLANHSDSVIPYRLKLMDVTPSDNKLDTTLVKYSLMKDSKVKIQYLSNIIDNVIDAGKIPGGKKQEYALRFWIDSNVTDESLINGKTLSYKVEVEADQVIEKPTYPVMRARDNYSSVENFYYYKDQITSIVFEDKIDIPDAVEDDKKWDVSASETSGKVMAYVEEVEGSTQDIPLYKLHIQGKNGVAANVNSSNLFNDFTKLVSIEGTEYFDTSKVANMSGMFSNCSSLMDLDVSGFDTSKVVDISYMFSGCTSLTHVDVSGFSTSNVVNISYMFHNCENLLSLDVSQFDTAKVSNMSYMFGNCKNLLSLDLSNFQTSNVENMESMFVYCASLSSLDVNVFDTSGVVNMMHMFRGCAGLKNLDLSQFDTAKVSNMSYMFAECAGLVSLDVHSFDTSNVTRMQNMFSSCNNLMGLNISHFNTSKVTDMNYMFSGCSSLTSLDVRSFDTSRLTSMIGLFYDCSNLTSLDLSHFNTSKVTSMFNLFRNCSKLANLDLSYFSTSLVTDMNNMFDGCSGLTSLVFGSGASFSKVTKYTNMFLNANPVIYVKTQTQVNWFQGKFPSLTVQLL